MRRCTLQVRECASYSDAVRQCYSDAVWQSYSDAVRQCYSAPGSCYTVVANLDSSHERYRSGSVFVKENKQKRHSKQYSWITLFGVLHRFAVLHCLLYYTVCWLPVPPAAIARCALPLREGTLPSAEG